MLGERREMGAGRRQRKRKRGRGWGWRKGDRPFCTAVCATDRRLTEISHKTCAICPYEKMCSGTCSPTPTILTEASQPCVKVGYSVGGGGGGILKGGGKEKTKSFR